MILLFAILIPPILTPGPAGSWDDELILDGHVILVNDTLKMWYLGKNTDHYQFPYKGIGLAYSSDTGKTWQKHPDNPVFTSDSTSAWETKYDGLWEAEVIYDNNEYKMWYQCRDSYDCYNTLYATSPDGVHWTRRNNWRPVLYAGYHESGDLQWDSRYAGARDVIKIGEAAPLYYMFYEAESFYNPKGMMMGLAIGINETTFAKVDTLKPVFTTIGTPDTIWSGPSIIPSVIRDNDTFVLIYSSSSQILSSVGLAFSKDGIHWERYPMNPVCTLFQLGMRGSSLTAVYWKPGKELTRELIGVARSLPFGIYLCPLTLLLPKP
jgi:predicted GH43/DUF377 family glycosyl hydrolase